MVYWRSYPLALVHRQNPDLLNFRNCDQTQPTEPANKLNPLNLWTNSTLWTCEQTQPSEPVDKLNPDIWPTNCTWNDRTVYLRTSSALASVAQRCRWSAAGHLQGPWTWTRESWGQQKRVCRLHFINYVLCVRCYMCGGNRNACVCCHVYVLKVACLVLCLWATSKIARVVLFVCVL